MTKIIVFDKGGRKERLKLIEKNKAPKDFLQGIDFLVSNGFDILNLNSSEKYKNSIIFIIGKFFEDFHSKISNIGIRPLSVLNFRKIINQSDYVVSLTDGFSISLCFYYTFFERKNKIKLACAFHKLSDYNRKIPNQFKTFYRRLYSKIIRRIDFVLFYGDADRLNSIEEFNIPKCKTHIIKFGVDTNFWSPSNKNSFFSNYLFSIGQDPARDYETLLKVKTNKKIHIHTSLLKKRDKENFKITHGSYNKTLGSFTDMEIRDLYRNSFAIIVPLKDVYQPSGYSVTLQAMACGKPVILTLTKGLWAPDLLIHFENCLLVKPYSPKDIEDAIELLQSDMDLYKKISSNSIKTVNDFFSINITNHSTLKLFNLFK